MFAPIPETVPLQGWRSSLTKEGDSYERNGRESGNWQSQAQDSAALQRLRRAGLGLRGVGRLRDRGGERVLEAGGGVLPAEPSGCGTHRGRHNEGRGQATDMRLLR